MKDNLIRDKSYEFAKKIIRVYKNLAGDKKEFVISKQLLRSGTSIGANIEEAIGGQSRKDFISKMSIAYKEARETEYWIRLLTDTDILDQQNSQELLMDCQELLKILTAIQKTTKMS